MWITEVVESWLLHLIQLVSLLSFLFVTYLKEYVDKEVRREYKEEAKRDGKNEDVLRKTTKKQVFCI